jgi:uncharacterized protein (DUF58 family)
MHAVPDDRRGRRIASPVRAGVRPGAGGLVERSGSAAGSLFDEDFRRRLERLRLVVRRTSPGGLHGEHRARRRGRGAEFSDYRAYVPGDDMRDVDWLAYLRFDRLLLRLFDEEGDLPVYLLLDASGSMVTPDRTKLDQAKRLLAAIGCIALAQTDRVTALAFAAGARESLETLRGANQIHTLLRFLERLKTAPGSDLAGAVRGFFARPRRPGLVVIASDFLVPNGEPRGTGGQLPASGGQPRVTGGAAAARGRAGIPGALDLLAALRHRVLALHLDFDLEAIRPPTPRFEAVDAETGERVRLEATVAAFREHHQQADTWADAVRAACRRHGFTYTRVGAQQPFDEVVLRLLRERGPLR